METEQDKKSIHYKVKPFGLSKGAIKDVDTVGRIVTGFYNTSNFFDEDYDVMMPGAAKKSIKERGPKSEAVGKIKHALNHDLTRLPGTIQVLEEKEVDGITGIYFETKMTNTALGNDTLQNYLEKVYDNHSIGFRYMQVEHIDRAAKGWDRALENIVNPEKAIDAGFMFLVKEIALYEGSTVAFGCNSLTPFLGVKSGKKESYRIALTKRIDMLEGTLRSGIQSDEMMKIFEIQAMQLKQMIFELTDNLPAKEIEPVKEEAKTKINSNNNSTYLNFNYIYNQFKL